MGDDLNALAQALVALTSSAGQFALHASRELAQRNPGQHARLLQSYADGLCDLRVTVALDKPPHVRLSLHAGERVEVLFDSARGLPPPAASQC